LRPIELWTPMSPAGGSRTARPRHLDGASGLTSLGRNDLCWCGSGKKYKRCHLDSDREADRRDAIRARGSAEMLVLDPVALRFGEVAHRLPDYAKRVTGAADELNRSFRAHVGGRLEGRRAAEALEGYLTDIETVMAGIASRHSRVWWLHTTRRLEPRPLGDSSPWTVMLYRSILTLATVKHGMDSEDQGDPFAAVETDLGKRLVPATLEDDDVIAVASLEYLAYEYNHAAGAYRRVGKGAALTVTEDDFDSPASDEVEELMDLVDRRNERYGSLGSSYGAAIDLALKMPDEGSFATIAFDPRLNVGRVPPDALERQFTVRFPGPTNYLPHGLSLEPLRDVLAQFTPEVVAAFGITPDALIGTIWALSAYVLRNLRENAAATASQIFRAGYLLVPSEAYSGFADLIAMFVAAWYLEVVGEHIAPEAARAMTKKALEALTFTPAELPAISLWDRLPYRLLVKSNAVVMIDYAAVGGIVQDVLRQIGFLDGDPANVKAANLEVEVTRRGRAAGFSVWESQRELVADDGKREIDTSFIVGGTLVVVECKAFAQNPRIDRGDFAALKARRETLEKYLEQARTLAEFIDSTRTGRNFSLPSEVERVEYLLCTPAVEYIWTRKNRDLWLTETHPRIIPPDELVEILGELAAP
jgi:hypothetical protein